MNLLVSYTKPRIRCTRSYAPTDSIVGLIKKQKQSFLGFLSNVNGFDIIRPKTCRTRWTLAVTSFSDSLYTRVAEQVIAFCNDNLKKGIKNKNKS